jgi:hypothetical protein
VAYREHLGNVKDPAASDAVVVLTEPTPDQDLLDAPGQPLVVATVDAFPAPGAAPRERMIEQRWARKSMFVGFFPPLRALV